MPKPRYVVPLLGVALLSACKLIDQTTFAPNPEPPAAQQVQALPKQDRRVPLLAIRYDVPMPSYADGLRYAVQSAERRNQSIEYDVVSVVPAQGSPDAQAFAALQGRERAVQIMRDMMRAGVPDTRLHLGTRADPAAWVPEVRIYVR